MMTTTTKTATSSTTKSPPSTVDPPNGTSTTISPKEQMKIEFYRTYDVMTGVRIAATLGGFFSLMVVLIVYKSKSKTDEALRDPKLAAAAAAEAEEEEQREIQAAVEATLFETLPRRSIDLASLPPTWAKNARYSRRFSSIGGYSSLLERRSQFSSQLPSFDDDDDDVDVDDEENDRYLEVPRRPSNVTCSSSGSSYLERRGSSILLGLPLASYIHQTHRRTSQRRHQRRRQSSPMLERPSFPIDIRVIRPTPRGSPCSSERALFTTTSTSENGGRRAPLASISSCNTSLSTDYPDLDANSFYSDVFQDDSYVETEDEAEENLSTDDEDGEEAANRAWKERRKKFASNAKCNNGKEKKRVPFGPSYEFVSIDRENNDDKCSGVPSKSDKATNVSCDELEVKRHSTLSLPSSTVSLLSPMTSEDATVTLPTVPLRQRSSISYSQETLF